MVGAVHLSRIESDWLALLGYDCAKLEFRGIGMYFKRIIEVRVSQQYFTSYHMFDSFRTLLVLVFPVMFDIFGS